MFNKSNRAGKSTRQMAKKRHQSAVWIAIIGIGLVVIIILFLKNERTAGIGGIGFLLLLILLNVIPDWIESSVGRKLKGERRAIRGAQAEEQIGELLEDLSDDYFILNDIESPYGNIDHIVISKTGGIFLIETKSHHGRVKVSGDTLLVNGKPPEKDFIAQVLRNTYWLRDEVGPIMGTRPWISPILVFTNAFVPPARHVKGVSIVNKKYLLNVLHAPNRSNVVNDRVWEGRETIGKSLI